MVPDRQGGPGRLSYTSTRTATRSRSPRCCWSAWSMCRRARADVGAPRARCVPSSTAATPAPRCHPRPPRNPFGRPPHGTPQPEGQAEGRSAVAVSDLGAGHPCNVLRTRGATGSRPAAEGAHDVLDTRLPVYDGGTFRRGCCAPHLGRWRPSLTAATRRPLPTGCGARTVRSASARSFASTPSRGPTGLRAISRKPSPSFAHDGCDAPGRGARPAGGSPNAGMLGPCGSS